MLGEANNMRYDKLKDKLVNDFTKGSNTYPQSTDKLLSFMNVYHTRVKKNCFLVPMKSDDQEMAFAQGANEGERKSMAKAHGKKTRQIEGWLVVPL